MQIVTISTDTPKQIRAGHGAHRLKARMLSDRDLAVTDTFGLCNQAIHSGPPAGGAKALPVPTSLLVDREGKVLWMDQSENYQRRSAPEYVLAALRTHLD